MASAFINRSKANNAGWDRAGVARAHAAQQAAENDQGDEEKHSGSVGDLRRTFRDKLERGGSPINELFMPAEPSTPQSSHCSHDEVRQTLKTTYVRSLLRLFTS